MSRLHLVTNNAGWFREPTIEISTISIPEHPGGLKFETVIKTNAGVDDLERYQTMAEAVSGHQAWSRRYRCLNDVAV